MLSTKKRPVEPNQFLLCVINPNLQHDARLFHSFDETVNFSSPRYCPQLPARSTSFSQFQASLAIDYIYIYVCFAKFVTATIQCLEQDSLIQVQLIFFFQTYLILIWVISLLFSITISIL